MKSETRRKLGLLAVVAASLAAAVWVLAVEMQEDGGDWKRVERRDLVIGVDVEGELEAVESARLGPPSVANMWNFKIASMAPEGAEVQAGAPVLVFDATELEQKLQEKIAERDAAEKELEKKVTDLEIERRDLELRLAEAQAAVRRADLKLDVPAEVAARKELEVARIDRDLAQLEIESIEASLRHLARRSELDVSSLREKHDRAAAQVESLRADVESMSVKAPRAGTVIYVSDWRGEKLKVSDTVWRAGTVLEIPSLERMVAKGEVAEADVGRLAVGQAVTLALDAHPDRQYKGKVRSIRRTVERKSRFDPKKIVRVEIELAETDAVRMRPGMRLRGTIEIERLADALQVPEEAVFPRPGGAVVYVRTFTGRREVKPELGAHNRDAFAVEAGLAEGDYVLCRGRGEETRP